MTLPNKPMTIMIMHEGRFPNRGAEFVVIQSDTYLSPSDMEALVNRKKKDGTWVMAEWVNSFCRNENLVSFAQANPHKNKRDYWVYLLERQV